VKDLKSDVKEVFKGKKKWERYRDLVLSLFILQVL
jgi:hypothetical protein